ncbi:macro domain-containing protein [Pseudoxanthomonas sp.]|uniref:type II toxin-antitoxin system antitoxin DNA ADP-ribosyl glycohydrolase DarG n=1 Tax=Pseudoxanthomonas sp. TaxID=1871049 RepID=UPI0025EC374C|nr:macro domain-containing protein [Pseudoxanthomonas sp.]
MSIRFIHGDMFKSRAEAIVNTVNCVGVMGKGVALRFRTEWPENYQAYKKACDEKWLRPGRLLVFRRGDLLDDVVPRYLVNFPTKVHWRNKSEISYIEDGLDALLVEIRRLDIKSIAMPPLGCGNGGLDWRDVRPIIERKLADIVGVDIQVYEPVPRIDAPEYVNVASRMTLGRALFLSAISWFEGHGDGAVDRLSLQKIAYFLQVLGVPLNLEFYSSLYGPYSDVLKSSLMKLEDMRYISGMRSQDRKVHVTAAGFAAAEHYLAAEKADVDVIRRLEHLVNGYENPYGLELLSTIHYLAQNRRIANGAEEIVLSLTSGNEKRRNLFGHSEVRVAYDRLKEDGLIDEQPRKQ